MRKEIKEISIFKFNELSEKAKEVVRNWYLSTRDSDIFTDDCLEVLKSEYGIDELTVSYTLAYCQGDGLCMYGKIYASSISDKFWDVCTNSLSEELKIMAKERIHAINFEKVNYHYCHANTVRIEVEIEEIDENDTIIQSIVYNNVRAWFLENCSKFEKEGYSYFYEIDDEDLSEFCDANDYEFLESGELYS